MNHGVKWVFQHKKACLACYEVTSYQLLLFSPYHSFFRHGMQFPKACFWNHWSNTHFNNNLHYSKREEEN